MGCISGQEKKKHAGCMAQTCCGADNLLATVSLTCYNLGYHEGGVDLGTLSAYTGIRLRDFISCLKIEQEHFSPLAPSVARYFKPPSPAAFIYCHTFIVL